MSKWENSIDVAKLENYFSKIGTTSGRSNRLYGYGGDDYFFELKCEADYLTAYKNCPPLSSIIGRRAKAFNNGIIELLDKDGNYSETSDAKRFRKILDKPNVLQTGKQFRAQQNIYIDIFGYCPVYVIRPVGMKTEISSMWNIPPWLFDINYTGKWLKQVDLKDIYKEYKIEWAGEKVTLDFENLFFVFDDGIGTENDTNLTIPDSKLVALEYPVSNIVAAYKSRNTLITKRGALGILSNAGGDDSGIIPMPKGEKENIQQEFKKYGIVGQPFQVIVSNAALRWQQMGFATKDLMLFEEIKDDIERLCDQYGFPIELLAKEKGTTFANKAEAKTELYIDTIIPELESRLEAWQRFFFPDYDIIISANFTGLSIFQESEKDKAEARKALNEALQLEYQNGLITKNDWLEALGRDRLPDKSFDEYRNEKDTTPEDSGA